MFEFTSYTFKPDQRRIFFNYTTTFQDPKKSPLSFTETIILPDDFNIDHLPKDLINKLLESLHIALGASYYKFYCATKLSVPYALSKKEADFWNTVYKKGLGEFFYKNRLNPARLPKFPYDKNTKNTLFNFPKNQKCLVGIGGGKDSIVSAELLKKHGFETTAFHVATGNSSPIIDNVIELLGLGQIKITRVLDPKVHQVHDYNGHIPISAIYAFLGTFTAVAYGYSYIIVSNEYSSNFGNTTYRGLKINHQWSKSFEFEKLFQDFVAHCISPDVIYFSLLRNFYEIRIVKLFSTIGKKHFPAFSSCNQNFRRDNNSPTLWCGQCAKCVFVFTLLSAFLSKKELVAIFGKNLYQDESLLGLFKDILGFGTLKPFDCVGTFQESQTALHLAKKNFDGDFIVRQLGARVKYHKEVFESYKENSIPQKFAFLGKERVYILGYGKEGKATQKYLKKYYPKIQINIGDQANDKQYLQKQHEFDLAIKTPGIKKELVTIPHTTATNIFFSRVSGNNIIIGVTGSKGKSTTASLIYHILKSAGKKAALLGNIGKPMLEFLLKPIDQDTIFILELSSYQLDDIQFSPDIAVVTNLFLEHLDYHGAIENYYQAKQNIINFQNKNQYFVYDKKTAPWLKHYRGKAVPFSKKKFESNLIGEHNQTNIGAAVSVAEILLIPEEKIKEGITSFKGLAHRLEHVGTFKGISFYDDAISTTPDSTIMAIKALSPPRARSRLKAGKNIGTIFLGGMDRGYDFLQLEKTLKQYNIKNVVLFPDSGNKILSSKKGLTILKTSSMEEAVAFAYLHTKKGEICLLSCASPSYSLWKNFEEKGDQFKKMVKRLGKI